MTHSTLHDSGQCFWSNRFRLLAMLAFLALLVGCTEGGATAGLVVSDPLIAMDGSGNALMVALYEQSEGGGSKTAVLCNVYEAGAGWKKPWMSEELLTDKDRVAVRTPAVAMDATGNGIAVWAQKSETDNDFRIYARGYRPTDDWLPALSIEFYSPAIYFGDASDPQVAMDGDGNATVVWLKDGQVFAQRWNAASDSWWSEAYPISRGGAANPRVAMSTNGDAIAYWQLGGAIYANRLAAGMTFWHFDTEGQVALGTHPRITMARCGNAILVYELNGDIFTLRYTPTSGWPTSAEQLDDGFRLASNPEVDGTGYCAGSGSEFFVAVWQEEDGHALPTSIYASLFRTGSGWQAPEVVESGSESAIRPHLAVNSNGRARVVWRQYDDATSRYHIYANRFGIGCGWEGAKKIGAGSYTGDIGYPRIALDDSDTAIAGWDDGLLAKVSGGVIHDYDWSAWGTCGTPTARFTFSPSAPPPGALVTFDASTSTDVDGTIVLYEWDFDNNGTFDATGATATHAYAALGSHTVRLRVTDNDGLSAETTQLITVGGVGGGKIVFVSDREGDFDIYTFAPDGLAVQLTYDAADDRDPVWSPDGRYIAFVSNKASPFFTLYVMNADGSGAPVEVADRSGQRFSLAEPAWSPDGSMIAFTARYSPAGVYAGYSRLYVVDIDVNNLSATPPARSVDDDSNPVVITQENSSPTWAPNNRTIAFAGDGDLYTIDEDGSNYAKILNTPAAESAPAWSPDGLRIAFVRSDGIHVMGADGSNEQLLASSQAGDDSPDWNEDGSQILCSRTTSEGSRIYVLDLSQNTAAPAELIVFPRIDLEPDW